MGANLGYALNERATPYVQVVFTRFQPDDDGNSSNSQKGHVGFKWQASERLNWDIHGGMVKTTTGGVSSKGWDGGANFSYATERTTTSLDFLHTTAPSGAISSLQSDRITGSWTYSLSELDQAGARISWVKNRSEDSSDNRQISVFYGRTLTDLWNLNVNYQHKQRQSGGLEANADVLGVTLTYSTPNF